MKPVYRQLLALLLAVVLGSALCLSLYVWDNKYTRPGAPAYGWPADPDG